MRCLMPYEPIGPGVSQIFGMVDLEELYSWLQFMVVSILSSFVGFLLSNKWVINLCWMGSSKPWSKI